MIFRRAPALPTGRGGKRRGHVGYAGWGMGMLLLAQMHTVDVHAQRVEYWTAASTYTQSDLNAVDFPSGCVETAHTPLSCDRWVRRAAHPRGRRHI